MVLKRNSRFGFEVGAILEVASDFEKGFGFDGADELVDGAGVVARVDVVDGFCKFVECE